MNRLLYKRAVVPIKGFRDFAYYRAEALAGLTVSIAIIPEAIAFSMVAGLSASVGLYTAFTVGLITALFGGKPGMISGATGAIAVGLAPLAKQYGIEYIFAAAVLAGILQVLFGWLKTDRLMRFISPTVTIGFLNGIAIIIFLAQLGQFRIQQGGKAVWMGGQPLYIMSGLVILTLLIIAVTPRITKKIPAALSGLVIVFLITLVCGIPSKTVGDISPIGEAFPPFHIANVPITFETLKIIFPFSLIMAAVGLIESLLTLKIISQEHKEKGNGRRESYAQGAANIVSGLFGGMGGCAMIGQSLINTTSGGKGRLSGIIASVLLLLFILFAAPVIERIPMAALTGVMVMVAVQTFNWQHFKDFRKIPGYEFATALAVMLIAVLTHNLALAILTGVVLSALAYMWNRSGQLLVTHYMDTRGIKHYHVRGAVFFGSLQTLHEYFTVREDPDSVVVTAGEGVLEDASAATFFNELSQEYRMEGKALRLIQKNLSQNHGDIAANPKDSSGKEDGGYV